MKQILILFIGVALISCNQQAKESPEQTSTESAINSENFDWLVGKWKRLNEEEGKETFENWEKNSDTEYAGIGFTMQNGDTITQEKMWLTKVGEHWDVIVKLPGEDTSVTFKGTSHNESEFICENPENDFPNKIRYRKDGDKISASISNAEMEIPFEFGKLSN